MISPAYALAWSVTVPHYRFWIYDFAGDWAAWPGMVITVRAALVIVCLLSLWLVRHMHVVPFAAMLIYTIPISWMSILFGMGPYLRGGVAVGDCHGPDYVETERCIGAYEPPFFGDMAGYTVASGHLRDGTTLDWSDSGEAAPCGAPWNGRCCAWDPENFTRYSCDDLGFEQFDQCAVCESFGEFGHEVLALGVRSEDMSVVSFMGFNIHPSQSTKCRSRGLNACSEDGAAPLLAYPMLPEDAFRR
jgi:hypothetical protein